jgi:hypothetical protein
MTASSDPLESFRGDFPSQSLNARRVAASLEVPGCQRRTVLEAAAVNLDKLGSLTSETPRDRQSPFAITRGNQFEQLVSADGMAQILALTREHLGLEIHEARQLDLSTPALKDAYPDLTGAKMNELRATLTTQRVNEMISHPDHAYNLIRHAVTRIQFGGRTIFLEQDVLAFAVGGRIHVVEVKAFPSIDGRADPAKASSAVRQSAVYILGLQDLMVEIGAAPDTVSTKTLIILPDNLTLQAVGAPFDIDIQVRRLRRQLKEVPEAAEILAAVPAETSLPAHPAKGAGVAETAAAAEAAREALSVLPPRFTDGCVSCPLFRHCRREADLHRTTARLGAGVAGACGNVTDIAAVLDLAAGRRDPQDASEAAVATALSRGAAAARLAGGDLA